MANNSLLGLGIDIGSTTIKAVVIDNKGKIIFSSYKRHFSDMAGSIMGLIADIYKSFPDAEFSLAVTGSGALGVAEKMDILFVQEVAKNWIST